MVLSNFGTLEYLANLGLSYKPLINLRVERFRILGETDDGNAKFEPISKYVNYLNWFQLRSQRNVISLLNSWLLR